MAVSIKAACVAVALGMGLFGATTAARAEKDRPAHPKLPRGGAPSPEVNTLLGFLVVAGTVASIKRRRDNEVEVEDAAA